MITTPTSSVSETLAHVIGVATDALSCEIGVVRDGTGRLALRGLVAGSCRARRGARRTRRACRRADLLRAGQRVGRRCPAPLDAGARRSTRCSPCRCPSRSAACWSRRTPSAAPRGFTTLCRRLGEQVADTAGVIAHTAVLREDLRDLADEQFRTRAHRRAHRPRQPDALGRGTRRGAGPRRLAARRSPSSPSTSTASRRSTTPTATTRATPCCAAARTCCATTRAATTCCAGSAATSSRCCSRSVPRWRPSASQSLTDALRGVCARAATRSRRASGCGTATPGHRVIDAVRDADSAMYVQKKARRDARLSAQSDQRLNPRRVGARALVSVGFVHDAAAAWFAQAHQQSPRTGRSTRCSPPRATTTHLGRDPGRNEAATIGGIVGGHPARAGRATPARRRAGRHRLRLDRRHRAVARRAPARSCTRRGQCVPTSAAPAARARRCGSRSSSPPATCSCSSTPT